MKSIYLNLIKRCFHTTYLLCTSCYSQYFRVPLYFRTLLTPYRLKPVSVRDINSYTDSEALLARQEVQNYLNYLSNEYKKIQSTVSVRSPVLNLLREKCKYEDDIIHLRSMSIDNDKELKELLSAEEAQYMDKIKRINFEIIMEVLSVDNCGSNSVILEVTPGIGGQEAKLFAEEIFDMYMKYAMYRMWDVILIDKIKSNGGGITKAEACISGDAVSSTLQSESGIHRVQRVPVTEKTGKAQTSTCAVRIVPEIKENNIILNDKELKIENKSSSGPGGQNVNKSETCVRITHIPTGTVVECQEERYQKSNKELALKKLRHILYQKEHDKNMEKVKNLKNEQVTSYERSEKIRTYNFIQNRVTDHRINCTVHNIQNYMEGNKQLHDMIMVANSKLKNEYVLKTIKRLLNKKNIDEIFMLNIREPK